MQTASTDRRVRKTKTLLRHSLLALLAKKELKEISIIELSTLADINRGTFYLHFKDVYELYEQMELEIINEFKEIISRHLRQNKGGIPFPVILEIFRFISVNAEMCQVILKNSGDPFLSKLINIMKPENPEEWKALFGPGKEGFYEYYYSYITSGCVGLITAWFYGGMKETPAKMAKLAEQMMTGSFSGLI